MPNDIDFDQEDLQNAMMNPNFKQKKAPESASKQSKNSTNASNWGSRPK
jgi:hypothetical protein